MYGILIIIVSILVNSVHCGDHADHASDDKISLHTVAPGSPPKLMLSKATMTDQGSHSSSSDEKSRKTPFFYGVTYYPWRTMNKNCSLISEKTVNEDLAFIATLAKSVQIFELYCGLGSAIVDLTAKYKLDLIMGVSIDNQSEFERQILALKQLVTDGKDLSHVKAITVGHSSVFKQNDTIGLARLQEISSVIKNCKFPIPVTMIIDSMDPNLMKNATLASYFDKVLIISVKKYMDPKVTPPDDLFYGFIDNWHRYFEVEMEKPKIYFTEFGYPTDPKRIASEDSSAEKFGHPPPKEILPFLKLHCVNKRSPFLPEPEPEPESEQGYMRRNRGAPMPPPEFKYFYHSAFDMPFEYPDPSDRRSNWGLADFESRKLKPVLKSLEKFSYCSPMFPFGGPHNRKPDHGPNGAQTLPLWIGIAISLALAILAVCALLLFFLHRRRKKEAKKKSMSTSSSNAYVRTLATYFNNASDGYIDVISKSDYENLSALVGPEWLIDESVLHFEEIIGEGHFGIVQRATLRNSDKITEVAVKRLHVGAKNVRQFLSEGILMEQFQHTNILPLVGISFTSYYLPMIITPFMRKGDLLSFVKNGDNRLTVRQLLRFGLEIAEGMCYLHDLKLIHRDLAARNCMLDDNVSVKIADFGLCRDVSDSDSYQTARASDIPIRWMPPETIEKLEWTNKSDVWSYGVVLWELLTRGKQPYTRTPLVELRAFLRSGGRLSKPDGCPDIVYDLMKNCWYGQAEQRPDFQQLRESIPKLVQALEGHQILDLSNYYNTLTMMEMNRG